MPGLLTRERRGELLTAACREIESLLMTQIFVGNVPDDASERVLRSIFERHGRVTSVRMANEGGKSQRRGFAFVSMPSFEDAEEAIARLNGSQLSGRTLTVNQARERKSVEVRSTPFRWDLMVP